MHSPFEEFAYHQQGEISLVNHRHVNAESYEMILVLSGGGTALIFDRTCLLTPGTLLFIDASYPHCVHPSRVERYLRSKVIIEKGYLQQVLSAAGMPEALGDIFTPAAGRCLYLDREKSARADQYFLRMKEADAQNNRPGQRLDILAPVFALIALALDEIRVGAGEETIPLNEDKLSPVLRYLREKCAETLTVERIAEDNHISKYYLCRLFRKTTGLTLMQYLYEQRLALARQQLADSGQSISSIAQNCGFGSSSHFCTAFRRREGISPNEYRKRMRRRGAPSAG